MCKLFPEYLTGAASEWFSELPRGSVHLFRDLASKFFNRFFQHARTPGSFSSLLQLKQRKYESLNDFMTRFTAECTRLKCSSDEFIVSAFKEGIQLGPLYQELCRIPPNTAQDLWKIAQTYAVADDAIRLRSDQERKNEKKHRATSKLNVFERVNKERIKPRASVNSLTPLTHSRSEIISLHRD